MIVVLVDYCRAMAMLGLGLVLALASPLARAEDTAMAVASPPEILTSEEVAGDKQTFEAEPSVLAASSETGSAAPASLRTKETKPTVSPDATAASSDSSEIALPPPPPLEPVRYGRALVSVLEKQTGRLHPVTLQQGLSQHVLKLEVEMVSCFMRSNDPQSSVALMQVVESDPKEGRRVIFSAWMFAEHPAISRLEHPVYDLTLLRCEP